MSCLCRCGMNWYRSVDTTCGRQGEWEAFPKTLLVSGKLQLAAQSHTTQGVSAPLAADELAILTPILAQCRESRTVITARLMFLCQDISIFALATAGQPSSSALIAIAWTASGNLWLVMSWPCFPLLVEIC